MIETIVFTALISWLVFKQQQTQKDIARLQDSISALQQEINKLGGWKNVAVNSIRFCDESIVDERKQFNEHIMRSF